MEAGKANEIKKLLEKAELTRYIHARLAENRAKKRKLLQLTVAILGMLVSILAAIYFRTRTGSGIALGTVYEELILYGLVILPAVATTIVMADATVLRLRDREEEHKSAVGVWGNWIRTANEARKRNDKPDDFRRIQKKYRKCMRDTPNTPMRTFLKFKREWISYKNESIRLDKEKDWNTNEEYRAHKEGESGQ